MMRYALLLLLCLLPLQAHAVLLFQEEWNGGFTWRNHGGCYPYSYQIVNDPCDATDKVLKITNKLGEDGTGCVGADANWNDPNGGCGAFGPAPCFPAKHRAESVPPFGVPHANRQDHLQEFWFHISVFVPADYPNVRLPDWIIMQSIPPNNADGTDLDLRLMKNGTWQLQTRIAAGPGGGSDVTNFGAIQRNAWTNWILQYKKSNVAAGANAGIITLWKNGVQVYTRTGITAQDASNDTLWKYGLYFGRGISTTWGAPAAGWDKHVLLFDNIRVAVGANQKNVVEVLNEPPGVCQIPEPPVAFQEDWENGAISVTKWRKEGACHDHSLNIVADPCDAGNKVLRVRQVMGSDTGACNNEWDVPATGANAGTFPNTHREEIAPLPDTLNVAANADQIVGYRVLIPASWPTVQPVTEQFLQYISPPFTGGPDIVAAIGNHLTGTRDRRVYHFTRNAAAATYTPTDLGPLSTGIFKQGVWNNVTHHFKRAADGTGRVQLWVNGDPVINYTGRTSVSADNTGNGARFKLGLYRELAVELAKLGETYDMYIDDIKIADSTDRALVEPLTPPGACLDEPPPPPADTNVIDNIGVQEETCAIVAHPKTNGLVIVPDNAELEAAVETNINKTILIKAGTYAVNNFEIGEGNVVKPFDCANVIIEPADDSIITASNWRISGLRFNCHEGTGPMGAEPCIKVTNLAANWWFRNNEMNAARRAFAVAGDASNGRVNGNMFEGCAGCVPGDLVEIGDVAIAGACTVTPCRGQLSPTNIMFTDNWLTGNRSGRTAGTGGGSLLRFNGVNAPSNVASNNLFTRLDDYTRPITITNSTDDGVIEVCRNTIAGPFFGANTSGKSAGPGILIDDVAATADRGDCRAVGDCPNHKIHHNYCEQCYAVDPGSDTSQQSIGFGWGDIGYSSGTIEFNVDNNRRANQNQHNVGEKIDRGTYRHNSHYQSSFRLEAGSGVCADTTASGDTLTIEDNVWNFSDVDDECAGSPDWLVDGNVFSSITGPGIAAGHLDTGNVTASIAYGRPEFESDTDPPEVPDLSVTTSAHQNKGALPTPAYVSGAIDDTCKVTAQLASYTGFTYEHGAVHNLDTSLIQIEYNDVSQTILAGAVEGDVVTLQMAACPNNNAVVTFNATHGWCQDSANIGGFFAPGCGLVSSCPTLVDQAIANNVSSGTDTITQAGHQFTRRFELPEVELPLAEENASIPVYNRSQFSLRFSVRVNEGGSPSTARQFGFELWARKNGGAWTEVTTNANATVGVYIIDNPNYPSRGTLTNRLALSGTTFASGGVYIDVDSSDNTVALDDNQQGEVAWSLSTNVNLTPPDTVELQLRSAGGAVLDTYNSTATITVRDVRGTRKGG